LLRLSLAPRPQSAQDIYQMAYVAEDRSQGASLNVQYYTNDLP
jgi:hypothetical protein